MSNLTAGRFLALLALVFVALVFVAIGFAYAGMFLAVHITLIAGLPVVLLGLCGLAIWDLRH